MDIHKCYTCSIGIYNMTTIVAILISFKDHLFPSLRQIESKLGLRARGNMDIQNCLNHSILVSNLAPMATILIFFLFKRHSSPNHTCISGYTETCWIELSERG